MRSQNTGWRLRFISKHAALSIDQCDVHSAIVVVAPGAGEAELVNVKAERIASSDDACRRLRQIPGIKPLVTTGIVASIGNGAAFPKGREFAAWLGLLPNQHSTGGKVRLYGISKRGNSY